MDIYTMTENMIIRLLNDIVNDLNDILIDISKSNWSLIKPKLYYLNIDIDKLKKILDSFNEKDINKYDKLVGNLLSKRVENIEKEIITINKIKYVSDETFIVD